MLFLSIGIAVIGLIIMLGIRQAAAVMLVVVSPLAFVCYMLPNTQSLFKRWYQAFQGLLVAYPVCSALVYGGDMAGTILLQSSHGNTWFVISEAVVSIAPIFVIPKVIRKSVGALSNGVTSLTNRIGGAAKSRAQKRMENSFLTRRQNYNQLKRGRRTLRRLGNNPAALGNRQRRTYNVALSAVNAANRDAEDAYRSGFAGKSDKEIKKEMDDAAKDGKLDANMVVAGLSSIHDEDQLTDAVRSIAGTAAYQNMVARDPSSRQRIASLLQGRSNSVINQSLGKLMNKMSDTETVEDLFTSGQVRRKVQDAGTSVMASQNKDVFNTRDADQFFSDEQLRAAAAAGYTGSTAASFHSMMSRVDNTRKETIVGGMTAEQVSRLNTSTDPKSGSEVGSLDAMGGAALIQHANPDAIATLKSDDGRDLRGKMDGNVMIQLGIQSSSTP